MGQPYACLMMKSYQPWDSVADSPMLASDN